MQVKKIILLFCTIVSGIVSGMDEMIIEEKSRSTSQLKLLIDDEKICQELCSLSSDVEKEVEKRLLGKKEWWYLDKLFIHEGPVSSVCYSPSGKQLATGSWVPGRFGIRPERGKVCIFDTEAQKEIASFGYDRAVFSVCYSPLGDQLAVGSRSRHNQAHIFDLTVQKEKVSFACGWSVTSVDYSPSGGYLVTASDDKKVRVFDIKTQKEIASFIHDDIVDSVCYSPCRNQLATGSWDKKVRVFDINTQREIASFIHEGVVNSVCYSPSGDQLATASEDKKVRIFDINTQREIASFAHGNAVVSVCYSPSGKHLATGSRDDRMHIFDVTTLEEIASFAQDDVFNSVCYSPLGNQLATGLWGGKVYIFSRYDEYTLEQVLLKKILFTWLLIERPSQRIQTPGLLLLDVATKSGVDWKELVRIWSSFPEKLRSAIWRTMEYKIKRYGKW